MTDVNSRTCVVYGLFAKSDEIIRYVGQTTRGAEVRLRGHLKRARNSRSPVRRDYWIRSVIASGDQVCVAVLQEGADWDRSEIEWIARLKMRGADLVNLTSGGEGMRGASPESRKKLSDSVKKLWQDPAYRKKAAGSRKGVPWSAAQIAARMDAAPQVRSDRAKAGRQRLSSERRSEISSMAAIAGKAKRLAEGVGLGELCHNSKLTDKQVVELRKLRASGVPAASIAKSVNMSTATIGSMLRGDTWKHLPVFDMPPIAQCGEQSATSKLSAGQVMEIRRRAAEGESMSSIGASFGKHRAAIRLIVIGGTWKHLPVLGVPARKGVVLTA